MRTIIQIAATPETKHGYAALYALCQDGSLWRWTQSEWTRVKEIPQDEPKK